MKRRHYLDAVPVAPIAARARDCLFRSEQTLKSWRAQRDYYLWLDECKLTKEELLAGRYLVALWRPIARRATFDDVGNIYVIALETDGRDYLIEELACAPD